MIRIVGGRYRGRKLSVPREVEVRPTTDRVREALFNILDHRFDRPYHNQRVLDLYAGAGTLGLEALSRGAGYVSFVERNRGVAAHLRRTVKGFEGEATVHEGDVATFLAAPCKDPYDLVFMDPPYAAGMVEPTLHALQAKGWLTPQGLVCVEQPTDHAPFDLGSFDETFSRRYGRTSVMVLSMRSP